MNLILENMSLVCLRKEEKEEETGEEGGGINVSFICSSHVLTFFRETSSSMQMTR